MTSTLPVFLAVAAYAVVVLGVGIAAGRWQKGREVQRGRPDPHRRCQRERLELLQKITDLGVQLTQAEDDKVLLGASLRQAWQRVAQQEAATPDDGVQVWEMTPEFVERLRSHRRSN